MKKMKSLKQHMMTVFSLALAVMTIAVCGPDQALANGRGRAGAAANVQQQSNARQRGVIMANTSGAKAPRRITLSSEAFEVFVNHTPRSARAQRQNNFTVNRGDGHDKFQAAAASGNQRRISSCGAGCAYALLIP
ncbi:MAG TPA: hypothetical protein VFD58_23880 [Blastocatellia bacterium]|nr:hypothetical protein [Blastocatellia bacterium]